MTSKPQPYTHLNDAARALIDAPDAARIKSIQSGTWLGYNRAKEILARMDELLEYPRITRMPNMLLVAPSFNGKTSILERFIAMHPVDLDATAEVTTCPVLMVESPSTPDVSAFYTRILDALMAPYKPTAPVQEKNSQVKLLFKQLGVKMLIVDEIHHLIAGSMNKQRDFRNALKSLGMRQRWSSWPPGLRMHTTRSIQIRRCPVALCLRCYPCGKQTCNLQPCWPRWKNARHSRKHLI